MCTFADFIRFHLRKVWFRFLGFRPGLEFAGMKSFRLYSRRALSAEACYMKLLGINPEIFANIDYQMASDIKPYVGCPFGGLRISTDN